MENKFSSNLLAFLVGIIVFGTDLFSRMPTMDRFSFALFGGYLFLSMYHAWKFASPRVSDLTSLVVFWLFPVVFTFTVIYSLLIGLVVSIPKFITSFFKWLSKKGTTRSVTKTMRNRKQRSLEQDKQNQTNIIQVNFRSK